MQMKNFTQIGAWIAMATVLLINLQWISPKIALIVIVTCIFIQLLAPSGTAKPTSGPRQ